MNETQKEKFDKIQRSLNPKTKVRNVFKIESDGTKTKARVIDTGDRAIFHCEKGPALVNEDQKKVEYYLNGIQYSEDDWKEIRKEREGLPWYKQSGNTIKTARF